MILPAATLRNALLFVNRALKENKAQPVLENVFFMFFSGRLYMKVTDLRATLVTSFSFDSNLQDGTTFLVNAVQLQKLCETMVRVDENLTLTINQDFSVLLSWSTGKQKIIGESPELYPPTPKVAVNEMLQFDSSDRIELTRSLKSQLYACSMNDLKPEMMGVNFTLHKDSLQTITTDGSVLTSRSMPYSFKQWDETGKRFTLPKSFVNMLVKANEDLFLEDLPLKVRLSTHVVRFDIGESHTLFCQLIAGTYPDCSSIFDLIIDYPEHIESVSRGTFLLALSRVLLTANEKSKAISLTLSDTFIILHSKDMDFGTETTERIIIVDKPNVDMSKGTRIGFNGSVLQKIVTNLTGDTFDITYRESTELIFFSTNTETELVALAPFRL